MMNYISQNQILQKLVGELGGRLIHKKQDHGCQNLNLTVSEDGNVTEMYNIEEQNTFKETFLNIHRKG